MQGPYSSKRWNQPNHHSYSKQDLYGPLKHLYNNKTYYGEQCLTLYIINYCFDSIDSHNYDNPRVCTYCYGKHHILFNTDYLKEDLKSNRCDPWEQEQQQSKCHDILCSNQEPLKSAHPTECYTMKRKDGKYQMKENFHTPDPKAKLYTILLCSILDPPKLAHSPQGMLLLIDPTGYYTMKRNDWECYIQEILRDSDPEVNLYHQRAYKWYIGKLVANMDYIWGDNESMINNPIVTEAKL